MGGACSAEGVEESVYRVLAGKPERKRPMGRPKHRWEDNIRRDLLEVGLWEYGLDAVMNLQLQ
jgi:hypothetical protein